jgi:uncharacterized membrane protein HdeD (DUF308 family)
VLEALYPCFDSHLKEDFMHSNIASMSVMFRRNWWALLLRGLAAIVFGVLTWLQPAASAAALVLVFGIYVLVDGVLAIISSFQSRQESRHWWVVLIWGLISAVVGLLMLFQPAVTALVMTIYIGVWALMTGVMEIVAAMRLRKEIQGEWLLILGGLISVLFGIFVLMQPAAGMMAMLWVLATYAVVFGVLMVILAFKVRRAF